MTIAKHEKIKNLSETEEALSDVSKLLSRLCKSRKAGIKLREIIELTGMVAKLTRSLQNTSSEEEKLSGYGDPNYFGSISRKSNTSNLIR